MTTIISASSGQYKVTESKRYKHWWGMPYGIRVVYSDKIHSGFRLKDTSK
jgi:hypothetical protein